MKLLIFLFLLFFIVILFNKCYESNKESSNEKPLTNDDVLKHTYYINLEHRTDRKNETIKELKSFGINNPIRFNAIKNEDGAIGCSKSHLEILKIAKEKNLPYVAIFEDDVKFINPNLTKRKLNNLLKSDIKWDVILLGGNNFEPYTKINNDFIKVQNCQTTTAYIVKREYYDKFIKHWEEGLNLLIKHNNPSKYACDQYWKLLQKQDNFILLTPLKVTQRESYSDIVKGNVNYENSLLKHN